MGKNWGKVNTLKCQSCGAGLTSVEAGVVHVRCEYCGQMVRVTADDESFNAEQIMESINKLGNRVRTDKYNADYGQVERLIKNHAYAEANQILNRILDSDITQARAWYYKSHLPLIESFAVTFRGCMVDIQTVARLTKREEIYRYLDRCGLGWFSRRSFMDYYATGGFLHEQQIRYLNDAIQYGSTPERREFFKKHKEKLIAQRQGKTMRRNLMNFTFATLLIAGALVIIIVGGQALIRILQIFSRTYVPR